ncbi:hypothetical protein DPMN_132101 [Dreissena polymorpha]|uniref:Uncharacterized protein n=1 Tax=Dreissena polymorpha TaxID=45954 RepID=A0A9D4FV99_DREPO|nr:hypothetical protein DPMN_132101 [Dreissena polymorpha]
MLGTYPVNMKFPYSICVSKDGTRLAVSNRELGYKNTRCWCAVRITTPSCI